MILPLRYISILIGIFILVALPCYAQPSEIESILAAVESENNPDEKARLYFQLSELITSTDIHESLNYMKFASDTAIDDELLGNIWDRKGRLYFALNNMDDALESFRNAKKFKDIIGNAEEAASVNNRVGVALLRQKKHQEALEVFLESASFFERTGDVVNLAMCHNNMAGVFAGMEDFENAVRYNELALPVFQQNEISQYEIITLTNLAGQYLRLGDIEKSWEFNEKAEILGEQLSDHYALGIIYNNFGQIAFEQGELESSLEYYEKSLASKLVIGSASNLVPTYNNLGQVYTQLGRPDEAIENLKKAMPLAQSEELWQIYSNLAKAYMAASEPDSSLFYFERTIANRDSIFTIERQTVLDELRTHYETERKDFEIEQLEARQHQNRILLTGLSGLFAASLLIAFLVVKNNNKKRIIAQQNEKFEKQHVEQLLKEQELIGINAMLQGQEKEREKIAEELHDSIGNSLATLKLFIESLEIEKNRSQFKNLHKKASQLLEHTYDDVRKIARNKNGGVLINKGLVPAVRAMADKISETQKINISVINAGLKNRLASQVEISTFKSIQEILSNAVKHSGATDVTVQFIQHTDKLTIMIEDNGNGFDPGKVRWGLGFSNIQKRSEETGGEFVIDSTPGNGSTIIINIPVS